MSLSTLGPTNMQGRSRSRFTLIRPRRGAVAVDYAELWRYRDLLLILAARNVKVRYKQTVIGASWAILQPLLTMLVFAVLFGALLGRGNEPSPEGVPYAISVFCGLLPWQLFAHALTASGNSLVENEKLVSKVYFPRLLIPASTVLAGLLDFALGFVVLLGLMFFYGFAPSGRLLFLPFFVLLSVITALAFGFWLAALNALYRDVRHTIPFIVQCGMFVTPVVYDAQSVLQAMPEWARVAYMLNPMAGVVEGFRWALLGVPGGSLDLLLISSVCSLVVFVGGAKYFRKMERTIADWV